MIDSQTVKAIAHALGAELCGIADAGQLEAAPEGYRPCDVMPSCRSVIVVACRFPAGTLRCTGSNAPYTRARNSLTAKMDALVLELCTELEKLGAICAPIPTNEAQYDEKTDRSRCIVSLKHAAQAAGLGTIGRHTLLITPELGSMLWLGGLLCTEPLEPDAPKPPVCDDCGLCVQACPVHALDGAQIAQAACWEYAFGDNPKTRVWEISCHRCRDACPYLFGTQNDFSLTNGMV